MPNEISIGGRQVGPGRPVYIVAEMSANHHQDFDRAVEIIRVAHDAGADAVKLQTYTPDTITIDCDQEPFRIRGTAWDGYRLYDLYEQAYTPWEWHEPLKEIAEDLRIDFFSTPFDLSSVEFLEDLGVPAYKVASFENGHLPLLRRIAETGKPVIMSTGMVSLAELDEAVQTLLDGGCSEVALLKCTSAYPAPPEEANLSTIPHMAQTFGLPVGLSDHTLDVAVSLAAVGLGACIIEKHLTLSRDDEGPDSGFSLEPGEFVHLVDTVRTATRALGEVRYGGVPSDEKSREFRRSLFVVEEVRAGEKFTERNLQIIRPGHGLHPRHLSDVVGLCASRDIERGTPLSWELISGSCR